MNIDAEKMQAAGEAATDLLKALANRHRLLLVCRLIERERSVSELADCLGTRDSTVSQHLALLRRSGIVSPRRDGHTVWYAIASGPARDIVTTLYRAYCAAPPRRGRPRRSRNSARSVGRIELDQ